MRALALLLTLTAPALAAERLPAPRAATTDQLQAALARCKAAQPTGDRCFNIQLALSAALLKAGDASAAQKMADTARKDAVAAWVEADDIYISAESRAKRPDATAADKTAYARATAEWKRLWVDQAIATEAEGDAWAARGWHRHAWEAYNRGAAIRAEYGSGNANRDARLRAAVRAAIALGGADGLPAGEKALLPLLAEIERIHGPAHVFTASVRLDLADMLAAQARTAEAEPLYAQARAVLRRDPAAAQDADARYIRFLTRADRKREAEPMARELLSRLLAARADKGLIATAYLDLAAILPLADALPLVREAVALRTARYGEKGLETARANIALARLLEQTERLAEAEALRKPALITIQAAQYIQHPETAAAYLELGENMLQQGRFKDSAYYFRTAMRAFSETVGANHPSTARATLFLAITALFTGSEDPRPLMQSAMPPIRAAFQPTHPDRLQAEYIHAMMLFYAERNVPAALSQIKLVAAAGLERARSYPDYGSQAQFEMRQFAPVFVTHIRFAWEASQLPGK